jgi:hypothetical protein
MTTAKLIPQHCLLPPAAAHKQGRTAVALKRGPATILKRRSAFSSQQPVARATSLALSVIRERYARRRPSMTANAAAVIPEEPRATRVTFKPTVRVKRIPNVQSDYTEEERMAMWHTKKQLRDIVARASAEVAFEGRDWQNAPEEEDFVCQDGKLLHPLYVLAEESSEESDGGEDAPVASD